jgi:recombination protein RecA
MKTLIAKINKKFGDLSVGYAHGLKFTDIPRITSGSLFMDWALGKNKKDGTSGWPLKRIVELYGPESAGKSLISMKTVAYAQKAGLSCVYIDSENTFDKEFAKTLGVDVGKLMLSRESAGEKVFEMMFELLRSEKVGIIVIDSLAALLPNMEAEGEMEQQFMAPMARMMSKGLRKLNHLNKSTLIIFINQLRVNPGTKYGDPTYTPGGNALKYYSAIRLAIRKSEWIFDEKDKKKKIGQVIKFRVVKNKSDVPLKEGSFKFLYSGEIEKADELISFGLLNKKIKRKGAFYYINSDRFQGRDDLESSLKKDKKLFEKAKELVFN